MVRAENRQRLKEWVLEALQAQGGKATLVDVAKHIWDNHEAELRTSGRLFYTWQYDMRWAATALRGEGQMRPNERGAGTIWQLA